MKVVYFLSLMLVGSLGLMIGLVPASWRSALDARPEAVVTGASLLLLAALLRRGREHWRAK